MNPASGRRSGLELWRRLGSRVAALGIEYKELIAHGPGSAEVGTREALLSGASRVVAVGGDGTLNEVVNGYLDESGQPINPSAEIAMIPAGTGSDFRRSIGISGVDDAFGALAEGRTRIIDAGLIEQHSVDGRPLKRFFINVVSFGLGGRVSATVNRWNSRLSRKLSGQLVFSAAALAGLAGYKLHRVTILMDGGRVVEANTDLLVVANGRYAGSGMMLAPSASLDDGLFDVVVTDGAGRLDVIKELPGIRGGHYIKNPKVSVHQASEITIETADSIPTDVDGESGGYAPARLKVLPGVIRFCTLV